MALSSNDLRPKELLRWLSTSHEMSGNSVPVRSVERWLGGALRRGVRHDPLFQEYVARADWRGGGSRAIADGLLRYLLRRSRAAAIGIRVNFAGADGLALHGVAGGRFQSAVERHLRPSCGGAPGIHCDLRTFGVWRHFAAGFGPPAASYGAVWLGYSKSVLPTDFEEQLTGDLASAAGDELRYLGELAKVLPRETPADEQLAQFSHDIRSPLNNVKAILSLLKMEELRAESSELIDVALSNCSGVYSMLENMLDLARDKSNRITAKCEEVDLRSLVDEVMEGFRVAAKMKCLSLAARHPDGSLGVCADKEQLRRVLLNVVGNAVKYTQFGGVEIETSMTRDRAMISIRDSGRGMTAEEVSALFSPFSRFGPGGIDGAGLGLYISKRLVEANNGRLYAESVLGQGSRFTVELTALRIPEDEKHAVKSGLRVLLVDDDADSLRSLTPLIERLGFLACRASTLPDAIGMLNFASPAVLVTDWDIPGGGGSRLLSACRSLECPPVIIVLSGLPPPQIRAEATDVFRILEKPLDVRALREALSAAAEQSVLRTGPTQAAGSRRYVSERNDATS